MFINDLSREGTYQDRNMSMVLGLQRTQREPLWNRGEPSAVANKITSRTDWVETKQNIFVKSVAMLGQCSMRQITCEKKSLLSSSLQLVPHRSLS